MTHRQKSPGFVGDTTTVRITETLPNPAQAGNRIVAIHGFNTNPTNRKRPTTGGSTGGGFTEDVLIPRSTFAGLSVSSMIAVGGETAFTFGSDAVSNVNCVQGLVLYELPGPSAFIAGTAATIAEAVNTGAGTPVQSSLTTTGALGAGVKEMLMGIFAVGSVGTFGTPPAPYGAGMPVNDRMHVAHKDSESATTESATQTWTTPTGYVGALVAYTQSPVLGVAFSGEGSLAGNTGNRVPWSFLGAMPLKFAAAPVVGPPVKLAAPMFASQLVYDVPNSALTKDKTQAQWDQIATWYRAGHFEGHGWAKILDSDGSSAPNKFTNGRLATHDSVVYVNGSYISQGSPLTPVRQAAHLERNFPLGIGVLDTATGQTVSGSLAANATTLKVVLPTSRPSPLPATHPNGTPSTFWPMIGSTLTPNPGVYSRSTAQYVSFVRVDDEIIALPPYSAGTWSIAGGVATITGVKRGHWGTVRTTHVAGAKVRTPIYIGSEGAAPTDVGLTGNPLANSTAAPLRYGINFYDWARGPLHDGAQCIADLASMELQAWHVQSAKKVTSVNAEAMTVTGHGYTNGARIAYGGYDIAPGTKSFTPYFVRDVTANTFKIAKTAGGNALPVAQAPVDWARGTWVLQEMNSPQELVNSTPAVQAALAVPGVVGFSLRMPWNVWEQYPELLDSALAIARDAGKQFTVRFMAGQHTPSRLFGTTPTATGKAYYFIAASGAKIPLPFHPTTGVGGNPAFETAFDAAVGSLAAWSRANNVRIMHIPWYGFKWAEIYNGPEIEAQNAYTFPGWLEGHRRLAAIAHKYHGFDLAVEHALSGHWGDLTPTAWDQTSDMLLDLYGEWNPGLIVQGNSFGEGNNKTTTRAINHAKQMVGGENTFPWNTLYPILVANEEAYLEVYTPSFTGGTSADLKTQAAAFAPPAFTPIAPADMVVAPLRRLPSNPVARGIWWDVSSVATYNNADPYGKDMTRATEIINTPFHFTNGTTATTWASRQRAKRATMNTKLAQMGFPVSTTQWANNFVAQPSQVTTGERMTEMAAGVWDGYPMEHFAQEDSSFPTQLTQLCQVMRGTNGAGVVVNPAGNKGAQWAKAYDWKPGSPFSAANVDQYLRLNYAMWLLSWRTTATAPMFLARMYDLSITERPSDWKGREIFWWDFGVPGVQPGGKPTNPNTEADVHQLSPKFYYRRYTKGVILANNNQPTAQDNGFRSYVLPSAFYDVLSETNRSGVLVRREAGFTLSVGPNDCAFLLDPVT